MEATDAIAKLKEVVGWRAVKALRSRTAVLKIWRNSSPHNWWVESKTGRMLWHSASERPRWLPGLGMFELVSDSKELVVFYWGSDSGQPCQSIYRLKNRFVE